MCVEQRILRDLCFYLIRNIFIHNIFAIHKNMQMYYQQEKKQKNEIRNYLTKHKTKFEMAAS